MYCFFIILKIFICYLISFFRDEILLRKPFNGQLCLEIDKRIRGDPIVIVLIYIENLIKILFLLS